MCHFAVCIHVLILHIHTHTHIHHIHTHIFLSWITHLGLDWPLNFHFLFYICSGGIVLVDLLTFLLPKSIETKRVYIQRTDNHAS